MPILNKLSGAFPATLFYITLGALIALWSVLWLLFFAPESSNDAFWQIGFLSTGVALFLIGLFLGRLGQVARKAELPPPEVLKAVEKVEEKAAENAKNPQPAEASAS